MVEPRFYDVERVINPHMEGNVGRVDRFVARHQWRSLVEAYRSIGQRVDIMEGQPLLPDLVFCANQALPMPPGLGAEGGSAVMSLMRRASREPEVRWIERFLGSQGLHIEHLDPWSVPSMEGTGDGLWHPGRALLWGGVGPRSRPEAWARVSAMAGVPVMLLRLIDPRFYHLDTCLSFVDEETAVLFPGAFDDAGRALLAALVPRLIEVDEAEAMNMACNGHSPDGRHYLVQRGSPRCNGRLAEIGLEVVELDTDQFLLSGGSVYCMKLHWWS
jgi:N-dimethylarginine dimethylaminohydrolase